MAQDIFAEWPVCEGWTVAQGDKGDRLYFLHARSTRAHSVGGIPTNQSGVDINSVFVTLVPCTTTENED